MLIVPGGSHDSAQDILTTMRRELLSFLLILIPFLAWCLSDPFVVGRKNDAEKWAATAEKKLASLRDVLESKERDLQAQRGELERLRRVEEQFRQLEAIEGDRLR